jgi:hypothetical protein
MIYLIGTKDSFATIFDESTLTDEQKKNALLVLKEFPPFEEKEGYYCELKIDENNKAYCVPCKIPDLKQEVKEKRLSPYEYKTFTGQEYTEE